MTLVQWNQILEIEDPDPNRAEAPIVEIFSNDPRLADLAEWQPTRGRATGSEQQGLSSRD